MVDAAASYDDLFDVGDHRLRNRLLTLGVAAAVVGFVAFGVWSYFFSGGGATQVQEQTATADRGNITKSVSTSGVVAAQQTSSLSFPESGSVTAVNVTLGQKVRQGDVLAEMDATDLQAALDAAKLNLASAQSKLSTLLQGATASTLASADQSLMQAQASYDKAVRAQQTLQVPPAATDVASAQQAVTSAQAALAKAQQARSDLDTASSDAVSQAQSGADSAQKALDKAQSAADAAAATVASSEAALNTAESAYCPDSGVSFCASHASPISTSDQSALVAVTDSGTPDRARLADKVLSANTAYLKALSDQTAASDAVDSADAALQQADDALSKAESGPTAADITSADAAISGAQVTLDTAQTKLGTLLAGPTQGALAQAQADVDTAAAALRSAQAKRDETYAGPVAADVLQQRQAVQQQSLAVTTATKNLDNAKLIAPFDGTVAVLNIAVGVSASGGGTGASGTSSASSAAIVLNTPDAVRIDLTVSETDLPSVKAGQTGVALFDAIPNRPFPIIIDAIGSNPTTTQGVVTYAARARLVSGGAGVGLAPGAIGGPGANRTPGANGAPGASAVAPDATKPAPGMNARITIITDQRTNVVRVPTSAITTEGRTSTVQVRANGAVQTVTVQTGLADGTNTEITGGLDEGAVVVIATRSAATGGATGSTAGTGAGTGGGFRFGGGGGGGGGDAVGGGEGH